MESSGSGDLLSVGSPSPPQGQSQAGPRGEAAVWWASSSSSRRGFWKGAEGCGEPPGLRGVSVEASRPESWARAGRQRWIPASTLQSPPACFFSGLAVWSQTPAPTCAWTAGPPQGPLSSGGLSGLTAPALALVLTWRPVQMPTFPLLSSFPDSALMSQSQLAGERGRAAWGQPGPDVPRGVPEARGGAVWTPILLTLKPGRTRPRRRTLRGSVSVQTKQRPCCLSCASRVPRRQVVAPPFPCGEPLSPRFQSWRFGGLLHPLGSPWA